jgi:antitoxin YefM
VCLHIFESNISNLIINIKLIDFQIDITKYLNKVSQNFESFIINGDNGIVIMSLAEYRSLCATQHELSSKENEKRLDSAIEKLNSGKSSSSINI